MSNPGSDSGFFSAAETATMARLHDMDMAEQVLKLEEPELIDIVAWRGDADTHLQHCARQVNTFMRTEYKGFINSVGRNIYPLIIASDFEPGFEGVGSSFTLFLRDGSQQKIAPTHTTNYEIYKALSHAALATFVILSPHFKNPKNTQWRGKLSELQRTLEVFFDALKSSTKPPEFKQQLEAVVNVYLRFIGACLDAGSFTFNGFKEFTTEAFAIIRKNMKDATVAQARAILPAMLKWKRMLGPEEWSKVYVLIPTVWPVALNSPRLQLFARLIDPDKIHTHIITSEFPRNFEEGRDVVGRVVGDRSVGRFVFGTADIKAKMKVLALSSRTDVVADDFEDSLQDAISSLIPEDAALVHKEPSTNKVSTSGGACPLGFDAPPSLPTAASGLVIHRANLIDKEGLWDIVLTPCGRIAAIVRSQEATAYSGHDLIDASDKAVIPGLVDAHIHLDKCFLLDRCCAVKGDFVEAQQQTLAAKLQFTVEDIRDRARKLIENEISFGTTLMRAHIEVDPIIGMKAVEAILPLKEEYKSAITIQVNIFAQEGITNQPGQVDLMRQALTRGVDSVGSAPYCDPDPVANIRAVFDLAVEFNVLVDFHLDYHLEGKESYLLTVIDETIARGWQNRVCLGHMTILSTFPKTKLQEIGSKLRDAGVAVLCLPASDMCMMARGDDGNRRRGVCPVNHLHAAGATAAFATNNVQNLFTFTGDGDVLKVATLLSQVLQLTSQSDAALCLDMATVRAAQAINVRHGLEVGMPADLVILRGKTPLEIIAAPPVERVVIKKGKIVARTLCQRQLFR